MELFANAKVITTWGAATRAYTTLSRGQSGFHNRSTLPRKFAGTVSSENIAALRSPPLSGGGVGMAFRNFTTDASYDERSTRVLRRGAKRDREHLGGKYGK